MNAREKFKSTNPNVAAPPKEITFSSLARDYLDEHGGDVRKASDALTNRLLSDVVILRLLVDSVISEASFQKMRGEMLADRIRIMRTATKPDGRAAVNALARGLTRSLLDFPLSDGTLLRNAMRDDVIRQAQIYSSRANNEAHKARWLTLIARATPPQKRVGDAITDSKALELWEKTDV